MAKHKSAQARRAARQSSSAPEGHKTIVALRVGTHQFPVFTQIDAAFGAKHGDYPVYSRIPDEYRRRNRFGDVFSALFFRGGSLEEHGLKLKAGVDRASFFLTMRALMCSFAPKHEVKEATVAWLLAEHTEALT